MSKRLIYSEDAIDAVTEHAKWLWKTWHETISLAGVIEVINNLPSAQPEYTEQDVRDAFNDGYRCGMESAQPQDIARDIATIIENEKDMRVVLKNAEPQHEVRFSDEDHVWINGKQYISLRRFMEAVKDARKDAYKHGKSKGIKKGRAMAQRWIPITERLPEQTGKYLVSVKNGNVYAGVYDSYGRRFQCAAVAWMPLPEPYKGEQG